MPANAVVEEALQGFKSEIDKLQDKDAKDALLEVHGKLTETYELRVEAADHAKSFGTLEADLDNAEQACIAADAAVIEKQTYGEFSLGELFNGWKTDPVPEKIALITKSDVRKMLTVARERAQTAFESLQNYINQDDEPSPRLAARLALSANSLISRLERLDVAERFSQPFRPDNLAPGVTWPGRF
jgi:hypothetical protein